MSGWDDPAETRAGDEHHRPAPTPDAGVVVLGRGGQGLVVAGQDRNLPREVAWKVVSLDDPRGVARLEREAALLASLEHPAIVPVYDLVRDATTARLALRQIHGQTLRDAVAATAGEGPAARLRLLPHVLAATHALAWAHHSGVVHRDVKSSNVMVGAFGETQVIDWGVALSLDEGDQPGVVVGTPQTMSPEQARGEAVDPRADVWGLGTILCEIITGRPLFDDPDPATTLDALRRGQRPRLAPHADIPRALVAIAERALAPAPEDRYADALALADDLTALLDGRAVDAHTYSAWETFQRFARTFRVPLAVGLAVVVTAAVAAGVAYVRISDERDAAVAATRRASVALVDAGLTNARRELDDDHRAEAELAAAQVLALTDHPGARGVIAAFARAPRPALLASHALPGAASTACRRGDVSPDGARLLCAEGALVRDVDLATGAARRAWSGAYRDAVYLGPDIVISGRPHGLTLSGAHGTTRYPEACGGALVVSGGALVDVANTCLTYLPPGPRPARLTRTVPCGAAHPIQSATPRPGGYVALCPDGRLVFGGDAPRSVPTPLASTAGAYRALAPLGATRLVVGTANGDLIVVDAATGAVLRRATLNPARLIRSVATSPEHRAILAVVDGVGPLLVHADSLASFARLPRSAGPAWLHPAPPGSPLTLSHLTLDRAAPSLQRWRVAPPAHAPLRVHRQDGRVGMTSLAFGPDDTLAITHSEHAELADARSGATRALASWPDLQGGIAKAIALDGPGAWAVLTSHGVPSTMPATGDPILGLGPYRRIVSVGPDPSRGTPRFVASDTGGGLYLIDHGGRHPLHAERFYDLHARGPLLAALADAPRVAHLYDLDRAPVPLASCPVRGAHAVVSLDLPHTGPLLLVADVGSVIAYDRGCAVVAAFAPRGEPTVIAATAAPMPALALVAAGTREGEVEVWDWSGRLLAALPAHSFAVRALAFDDDGLTLASGAWDGRLRLYDTATLLAPADALVGAIRRAWGPGTAPSPAPADL